MSIEFKDTIGGGVKKSNLLVDNSHSWQATEVYDYFLNKADKDHSHTSVNGVTPEWIGSLGIDETKWLAAWNSDGSKIKAINKDIFAKNSEIKHWYTNYVDLSSLDESLWYPVTFNIPIYYGLRRVCVSVGLNTNVPSWSKHNKGFSCEFDLLINGSGWGTTNIEGIILKNTYRYADEPPIGGYNQLINSTTGVIYFHGGGCYFIYTDYKAEFTVRTSKYEVYNQSVEPIDNPNYGIYLSRSDVTANLRGQLKDDNHSYTATDIYNCFNNRTIPNLVTENNSNKLELSLNQNRNNTTNSYEGIVHSSYGGLFIGTAENDKYGVGLDSRVVGNGIVFNDNTVSIFNNDYDDGTSILSAINRKGDYYFHQDEFASRFSSNLGTSSNRWNQLYALTSTISTSDRRLKNNINDLNGNLIKSFILGLKPSSYKLIEGQSGRTHYGLIAQDVEELMNKLNMSSMDFAGFIKSPKYNEEKIVDEKTGREKYIKKEIEGEYIYSLRYEEFIAPLIKMVQMQQEEINELKREINELKNKVGE